MPYCSHCGSEIGATDRFCERCGKPAVSPNDHLTRRAADKATRQAERSQERQAAEQYYQRVGSRHPHIWPVTGIGSALFLVCIAGTVFAVYQIGGAVSELVENPGVRFGIAAAGGVATWFVLTVVRYTMFPEVRPRSNPDMMGEKGDFWVFLIGIPLIILAIIGWLSR